MNSETIEITGEYWIDDGNVQYADGDIGDYNHEALAVQHVCHQFIDQLRDLAEELGVELDRNSNGHYDDENPDTESVIREIKSHLEQTKMEGDPDQYIQSHIKANNDAYPILNGGGDAKDYVMIHDDWIAVRGHDAELYGWDNNKRSSLASGIGDILDQEGHHEELDPEQISFYIHDHKTGKAFDATLAEIEATEQKPVPVLHRLQPIPQPNPKGITDKRFLSIRPDSHENRPQPKPDSTVLKKNTWTAAAKDKKLIGPGQELWRGTSESILPFSEWIIRRERRQVS